jgi:hypothetical protein
MQSCAGAGVLVLVMGAVPDLQPLLVAAQQCRLRQRMTDGKLHLQTQRQRMQVQDGQASTGQSAAAGVEA